MTIKYPDGIIMEAVVLMRNEQTLRVAVKGGDDIVEFMNADGTWLSEDGRPVQIEFQWQKRSAEPSYSENDFICPQTLASRLIQLLHVDNEEEATEPAKPRCFAAGGAVA
jgi:hypothetical protein